MTTITMTHSITCLGQVGEQPSTLEQLVTLKAAKQQGERQQLHRRRHH